MSTETSFLSEIIHAAPKGAVWIISSDSWPPILDFLGSKNVFVDNAEWRVGITEKNKKEIENVILDNDLADKLVHTYLLNEEEIELFSGLDAMSLIVINEKFGLENDFKKRFPDIEIYYK